MKIEHFLDELWSDYISITPIAKTINNLLECRGEHILNDHIALRTFAHENCSKERFVKFFEQFGYKLCQEYNFVEKKLEAVHLENRANPLLPKIFISELLYDQLPDDCITIINREIKRVEHLEVEELFSKKDIFKISYKEYQRLYSHSEYAAWLCSVGFRPNHFTINVNQLKTVESILELNSLLKDNGVILNSSGGEVKGSPDVFLEQSSTMADQIEVRFDDEVKEVPSCYYEFAYRYKLQNGKLFQGFVANSADKIFESTNE